MTNETKTAEETSTDVLLTVFEIVKKDFDKEVRKMDYSEHGQTSVNNFYNTLNKITNRLTQQQSAYAELKKVCDEYSKDVSHQNSTIAELEKQLKAAEKRLDKYSNYLSLTLDGVEPEQAKKDCKL